MSRNQTTTFVISREALHGSRRAGREQSPLLREGTGSAGDGPADVTGTDDDQLEVSIPDVLVRRTDEIRVLHVDDNPEYTDITKTFLERDNDHFAVVTETSAVEAFRRLHEERFDCLVSDYEMPTTDGLELLELVRDEFPDLPFILFTGAGDEQLASDAIAAGVTDYVRKQGGTQQYDVLANRIDNAVQRHRTQRRFWDALSWYKRFVEQDLAGVCVVQSGEFVYVNERFADILGRSREALLGSHPSTVVCEPGTDFGTLFEEHDETFRTQCTLERADGTTVTVEVNGGKVKCGGEPGCIGLVWKPSATE